MGGSKESNNYVFSKPFPTLKVTAMNETLSQAVVNFKELVSEFEQLHLENINYQKLLHEQKEKLESQSCSSCDELRKAVATKEQIIDSITSALNKLTQTKDFNLIEVILKQIYCDTTILTPPKSVSPQKENNPNVVIKEDTKEKNFESTFKSPKKEVEDQICKDESVTEIEGTPTGRKSPIFQSKKKTKPHSSLSLKDNKKKCSDSWSSPESKAIKLIYPSPMQGKPGGRLRQGRLSFVKIKTCQVVDLTCSPEHGREIQPNNENNQQKEVIDNDETILPSPTSGPVKLPSLYKSMAKDSPTKFKKPPLISKFKMESETDDHNIVEQKDVINNNGGNIENSINLLNQYPNRFKSPVKRENMDNEAQCGDESISLLQHNMKKIDCRNNKQDNSPSKRPLAENVNITNTQHHVASPSLLQEPGPSGIDKKSNDDVKRVKTNMAPVYKEPTVRKKAEKRALPGWSCDQCRIFYDELYKNDPEMLAKLMEECSKHRGRTNPVRPSTPGGFWEPRWDVPEDTEEFNRRNNAV
ncbi:uncharacterized protein LOC123872794 isoform X2 [Maniola jurtina]|uniref:uncharacterized protein LOC123872794 isoform X2 n=1 Tax=Maniola jurtina TaxID=191418 RepID=UPI001E6875CE|nr:uncharacterized protein LOC123872794 isoform X2 [Maniola jurtina]